MGYRIRELRKQQMMTQEELSRKSGVSRTTISGLESGEDKETSTKTLLKLANALGATVEQIFFGDGV